MNIDLNAAANDAWFTCAADKGVGFLFFTAAANMTVAFGNRTTRYSTAAPLGCDLLIAVPNSGRLAVRVTMRGFTPRYKYDNFIVINVTSNGKEEIKVADYRSDRYTAITPRSEFALTYDPAHKEQAGQGGTPVALFRMAMDPTAGEVSPLSSELSAWSVFLEVRESDAYLASNLAAQPTLARTGNYGSGGLSGGAAAGIAVAVIVIAIVLVLLLVFLARRSRRQKHAKVADLEGQKRSLQAYSQIPLVTMSEPARSLGAASSPAMVSQQVSGGNGNGNGNNPSGPPTTTTLSLAGLSIGSLNGQRTSEHTSNFLPPTPALASRRPSTGGHQIPQSKIELLAELGRGSLGTVYLGNYELTEVAVKLFDPSTDPSVIQHEIDVLCALRHPNCVLLMGSYIRDDGQVGIVMERLSQTLHAFINRRPMPTRELAPVACNICAGMQYLHGRGMIHRDLKAGNIMMTSSGVAKIADFGLSKMASDSVASTLAGTVTHMAPEVLMEQPYTNKVDVYSFGMVLYHMATGHSPFSEIEGGPLRIMFSVVNEDARPLWPEDVSVDPQVKELAEMCWSRNPDLRPTFAELTDTFKLMK